MAGPWTFGWTPLLTIVALSLTSAIAIAGFRTFGKWKRERLEEKKIEVSLEALALAYESKHVFAAIRSRVYRNDEWAEMTTNDEFSDTVVEERKRRGPYYAVLKRIEGEKDFFARLWTLHPKFMAIFGPSTGAIFDKIHEARRMIETACELLMWSIPQPERSDKQAWDDWTQLRANIWASEFEIGKGKDKVGKLTEEFRTSVEKICRPVIDRGYKSLESPCWQFW
jgi:hypothetical protein